MKLLLLFLSIILTANLASCRVTKLSASTEGTMITYAITNTTIVDVEQGITVPTQTVLIAGEQIVEIGDYSKLQVPSWTVKVDGEGLYLMPGLIDAHVHYFDKERFGRLLLANGVLLVRDMGMPNFMILPLRNKLNNGKVLGPEMITTGIMIDGDPPLIPLISKGVTTPEEGQELVREQAEKGVDMIKTYSRLDKDVFLAILDEANKYGLQVVSHLPESIYIEDAADAGLASSEHFNGFEKVIAKLLGESARFHFAGQGADARYLSRLDEVDPEELKAVYRHIQESGMVVCPTVVTFKTLTHIRDIQEGNFLGSEYVSPSLSLMWKAMWSQQDDLPAYIWLNWAKMVVELNQAGVPLMIGTDLMLPGILPGFSVHEEMAIWQEAGIPAVDILRSATIVPARFMRLSYRLGTVGVGKVASIVLVQGNPLEDIRNAQKIAGLFLRGQYFSRNDLDQLLEDSKVLNMPPETARTGSRKEFV